MRKSEATKSNHYLEPTMQKSNSEPMRVVNTTALKPVQRTIDSDSHNESELMVIAANQRQQLYDLAR